MNLLFICNQNQNRSPTAELMYKENHNTYSRAFFNMSKKPKKEQLEEADIIFVFEHQHLNEIRLDYPGIYLKKKIVNLQIPDIYRFNSPSLRIILKERIDNCLNTVEMISANIINYEEHFK